MSPLPSESGTGRISPVAASVLERAEQLVQLLRDLVRCDAVMLTASNPFASSPRHEVLAADGYSGAYPARNASSGSPPTVRTTPVMPGATACASAR
ncbi:hypothetical protein OG203_05680 [Nocardia sp. NBC_01499]|uniref:hypothetical protein n=1 Tax=Nocardia sp. NBC_01499 TaxID=2903597 RepID=UPI00386B8F33